MKTVKDTITITVNNGTPQEKSKDFDFEKHEVEASSWVEDTLAHFKEILVGERGTYGVVDAINYAIDLLTRRELRPKFAAELLGPDKAIADAAKKLILLGLSEDQAFKQAKAIYDQVHKGEAVSV